MPMIEFRYDPKKLSEEKAEHVGGRLERAVRESIKKVRPKVSHTYGVTTEGEPFRIAFNQPDLRIYIFYHQEWEFTELELGMLAIEMKERLVAVLYMASVEDISVKVRFYARAGHASASIP